MAFAFTATGDKNQSSVIYQIIKMWWTSLGGIFKVYICYIQLCLDSKIIKHHIKWKFSRYQKLNTYFEGQG